MIELIIFSLLISTYTLWIVMRTNKKIDLVGQLGALILTQVSRQYTADDYPEEDEPILESPDRVETKAIRARCRR